MGEAFKAELIEFRHLTEDDLPIMHRWLNRGEALRWYGIEPTSLAEVEHKYAPMLHGQGNVLALLATYDEKPIGYVQRYFPREHPDYWGHQHLPDDTAGVDLFIGEESFQHRGFGPVLLRRFLHDVVFAEPNTERCIVDPDPANTIAIRAYEKIGFRYLRTLRPPEHCDDAYLMMLERGSVR